MGTLKSQHKKEIAAKGFEVIKKDMELAKSKNSNKDLEEAIGKLNEEIQNSQVKNQESMAFKEKELEMVK